MEAIRPHLMEIQTVEIDALTGKTISVGPWTKNTFTLGGKTNIGYFITGHATGAATTGFIYVMAGSGSSALGSPAVSVNDDRLGGTLASHATAHEYIANVSRKPLLSALTTGASVTAADWVDETIVISGVTYHKKMAGYVQWLDSDANATAAPGVPFRRYGLNNASACPTTATGLSGTMLNEVEDSVTMYKTTVNILQTNVILRI